MRTLRLLLKTWRARFFAFCDSVERIYRQRTCPHSFRAALVANHPARVCRICDLSQQLSREEFYAQFGEKYQAMIGQTYER